ncbi:MULTISPECIES: hypothetical protein [Nocardia]|uniref:hypothetical protein n=1 Tax=Nocardia TaxID=1817 RepID=UPI002658AF1A|nr:hypothetical protein [Nocardia sp. PE-7]WKG08863.1 hypothetical protein QX204_28105 [Nocardia sp. PE-7]
MTAVDLSRHYESGPWIVVVERETDSKLLLAEIDRQCKEHGVYIDVVELADVKPLTLFRYKGMIVLLAPVIPPADVDPAVLDSALELIREFRKSYLWGVSALVGLGSGHAAWHEVGMVQFIADATAFADNVVRSAINSDTICGHHVLRSGKPVTGLDLFAIYEPDDSTLRRRSSRTAMKLQTELDRLRSWGLVVTADNIAAVRARIKEWTDRYNGKRYNDVPGSTRNVLEWVISDPDTNSPTPELAAALEDESFRNSWNDGTQRAARLVLDDLLKTFGIERPRKNGVRMHGKKGQCRALAQLVATMNQITDLLGPELDAGGVFTDVLADPDKEPVAVHE